MAKTPEDQENEPTIKVEQDTAEEKTHVVQPSEKEKPEVDYSEEFKKAQRRMEYQTRALEKERKAMNSQIQDLSQKISQLSPTHQAQPEVEQDDLDKLAEKDWKKAVRKLGREEAEAMHKELLEKNAREARQFHIGQELEQSKSRVRDRYPNVEVEGSEENRLYIEAINKNPGLLQNPRGPELAMYAMEESMRTSGKVPMPDKPAVDTEVQRRTRIGASAAPQGRQADTQSETITQSEKEFCDNSGIPYARYVEQRRISDKERREGVST